MEAAQTAFDAADHNNAHLPDLVRQLLEENKHFAAGFDKCMSLGAKKKISIVTCMDSRLLLDKMLPGVDIGDIEIIRNAGGRVTFDVVRSLFVAQEVPELSTHTVLVVHHTDCGAQAAVRHHDLLAERLRQLLGAYSLVTWLLQMPHVEISAQHPWWGEHQALVHIWSTLFLPRVIRKKLLNMVMRPFSDPIDSVKEDVWLLRHAPLMPKHIPIHGLVYDVTSGQLHHVTSSSTGDTQS